MRPGSAVSRQSRPGSALKRPGSAFGSSRPGSALPGSRNNNNTFVVASSAPCGIETGRGENNNTNFAAVMNNSERVHVAVRLRPFLRRCDSGESSDVAAVASGSGVVVVKGGQYTNERERAFEFDHVIDGNQIQLYEAIGAPMLKEALGGFNVCLFAFGSTGSGKTHSILEGATPLPQQENGTDVSSENNCQTRDPFLDGLLPRLSENLFLELQQKIDQDPHLGVKVSLSVVEIYMEKVRDLLASSSQSGKNSNTMQKSKQVSTARSNPNVANNNTNSVPSSEAAVIINDPDNLDLFQEEGAKKVKVKGLSAHPVLNAERVRQLLFQAMSNRQTAETKANEVSSRSHCLVTLNVTQFSDSNIDGQDLESTITIVDLAGSERQGKSETSGQTLEEGKKINLSLLTLGRALHSLSSQGGNRDVVSLRESKLTRLLGESLCGNSKTWMLATIAAASCHTQESLSTLEYATHARAISNKGVHVNQFKLSLVEATKQKLVETIRQKWQENSKSTFKFIEASEFQNRIKLAKECFEELAHQANDWIQKTFLEADDEKDMAKKCIRVEEEQEADNFVWKFVLSDQLHFSGSRANRPHRIEVEYGGGKNQKICDECKTPPAILCSIVCENDENNSINGGSSTPTSESSQRSDCGEDQKTSCSYRLDLRIFSVENLPKFVMPSTSIHHHHQKFYLELYSKYYEEENENNNLILGAIEFSCEFAEKTNSSCCRGCYEFHMLNFHKCLYFVSGMPEELCVVIRNV